MSKRCYDWIHGSIFYQKRGLGDPLVLVHNIYPGASSEEFERNIDELSHHHTVYAIDLMGFGDSAAPWLKYTAGLYANLIRDFIADVIKQPTDIVASGLSCGYVVQVAAWRPELFRRMVLVCPRSEPINLIHSRWWAQVRHMLLSSPLLSSGFYETMTSDYELRQFLFGCFYNSRQITKELVERLRWNASRPGSIYPYASLLTGFLDGNILKWLPRVQAPVMIVWGSHAQPAPVEHSVRLAACTPNCRLAVLPEAGAWAHMEQSAMFNRMAGGFFAAETDALHEPAAVTA